MTSDLPIGDPFKNKDSYLKLLTYYELIDELVTTKNTARPVLSWYQQLEQLGTIHVRGGYFKVVGKGQFPNFIC